MPTLVTFNAHPDDEAIATAGVMAKAVRIAGRLPAQPLERGFPLATRCADRGRAAGRILHLPTERRSISTPDVT